MQTACSILYVSVFVLAGCTKVNPLAVPDAAEADARSKAVDAAAEIDGAVKVDGGVEVDGGDRLCTWGTSQWGQCQWQP